VKRNATFSLFATAMTVLFGSAGCHGVPKPEPSPEFVEKYELEGFPYPDRFEFLRGFQYAPRELAGVFEPTWIGYYKGPGRPADHVPFFIREMQARGWRLRELVADSSAGKKSLEFIKKEKGTRIELSRVYDGSRYGTSACLLKAEVRTLGLESFSIEENLALIGEGIGGSTERGGGSAGTGFPKTRLPTRSTAGVPVEGSRILPTAARTDPVTRPRDDRDADVHLLESETAQRPR